MKIGISGDAGSFSEEAGRLYAERAGIKDPSFIYLIDMEGVLAAVEAGTVERGIFPVVNFQGGLVKPAFEAMGKYFFKPIDELWLDVQQCLLVTPGVEANQIKKIVSHPQALAQCRDYLKKEWDGIELIEWIDTAKAARDLSEGRVPKSVAVIAPLRAAELYHLDVMKKNIQDRQPNFTIFVIAEREIA